MEAFKSDGKTVIRTPVWVLIVRIAQVVLSLILLGLVGWWIHGLYSGPLGFGIVCCIFTWVVVAYTITSEKVKAANHLYNTWAVLALDGLMVIFWLSAMGAIASYRGGFTVPVQAECTSDGSAIDSGTCNVWKRKVGVATHGALGVLSGIAALSAFMMVLFVITLAYVAHQFRMANEGKAVDEKSSWAGVEAGEGVHVNLDPVGKGDAETHHVHSSAVPPIAPSAPLLHQGHGGHEQPVAELYPQQTGHFQQQTQYQQTQPQQYHNPGSPYGAYDDYHPGFTYAGGR